MFRRIHASQRKGLSRTLAHHRAGEKAPEEDAVRDRSAYLEKTPDGTAQGPADVHGTGPGPGRGIRRETTCGAPPAACVGETGARSDRDIQ